MTITSEMLLDLPEVGSTLGPEWAEKLNAALEAIDTHSHVANEGVPVPTAGLNINADLQFNGFSATELNASKFNTLSGTAPTQSVYVSGGELFYRDINDDDVQITVNGAVSGSVGNITGMVTYDVLPGPITHTPSASFSESSRDFSFFYDTSLLSAVNMGDIRLFPYDGNFTAFTNFVTLKSPTALSSPYALTMPLVLPASTAIAQSTSAGVLTFSNTISQPVTMVSGLTMSSGTLKAADGSAVAPAYTFTSTQDTGMFSPADNTIAWSTDSALRLILSTTDFVSTVAFSAPNILLGDSSAVNPAVSFSGDPDTGMYREGINTIAWTTGGTLRLSLSTTNLTTTLPFQAPSLSTGGGAYKIFLHTSTSTVVGTRTIVVPGATAIIGATGYFRAVVADSPTNFAKHGVITVNQGNVADVYFLTTVSFPEESSISVLPANEVAYVFESNALSARVDVIVFYI